MRSKNAVPRPHPIIQSCDDKVNSLIDNSISITTHNNDNNTIHKNNNNLCKNSKEEGPFWPILGPTRRKIPPSRCCRRGLELSKKIFCLIFHEVQKAFWKIRKIRENSFEFSESLSERFFIDEFCTSY